MDFVEMEAINTDSFQCPSVTHNYTDDGVIFRLLSELNGPAEPKIASEHHLPCDPVSALQQLLVGCVGRLIDHTVLPCYVQGVVPLLRREVITRPNGITQDYYAQLNRQADQCALLAEINEQYIDGWLLHQMVDTSPFVQWQSLQAAEEVALNNIPLVATHQLEVSVCWQDVVAAEDRSVIVQSEWTVLQQGMEVPISHSLHVDTTSELDGTVLPLNCVMPCEVAYQFDPSELLNQVESGQTTVSERLVSVQHVIKQLQQDNWLHQCELSMSSCSPQYQALSDGISSLFCPVSESAAYGVPNLSILPNDWLSLDTIHNELKTSINSFTSSMESLRGLQAAVIAAGASCGWYVWQQPGRKARNQLWMCQPQDLLQEFVAESERIKFPLSKTPSKHRTEDKPVKAMPQCNVPEHNTSCESVPECGVEFIRTEQTTGEQVRAGADVMVVPSFPTQLAPASTADLLESFIQVSTGATRSSKVTGTISAPKVYGDKANARSGSGREDFRYTSAQEAVHAIATPLVHLLRAQAAVPINSELQLLSPAVLASTLRQKQSELKALCHSSAIYSELGSNDLQQEEYRLRVCLANLAAVFAMRQVWQAVTCASGAEQGIEFLSNTLESGHQAQLLEADPAVIGSLRQIIEILQAYAPQLPQMTSQAHNRDWNCAPGESLGYTPIIVLADEERMMQQYSEVMCRMTERYFVSFIERSLPPPIALVVDECVAVCLVSPSQWDGQQTVKSVTQTLVEQQQQFDTIHIIVDLSSGESWDSNLVLQFVCSVLNFGTSTTTLRYTYHPDATCRIIRSIFDAAESVAASSGCPPDRWYDRHWLLERETTWEQFLSRFPSINHYLAQLMLRQADLQTLLNSTPDEILKIVQRVAKLRISSFIEVVNISGSEFYVSESSVGTLPDTPTCKPAYQMEYPHTDLAANRTGQNITHSALRSRKLQLDYSQITQHNGQTRLCWAVQPETLQPEVSSTCQQHTIWPSI